MTVQQPTAPARLKLLYVMPNTRRLAGIEGVVDDITSELARRYVDRFAVTVLFTSDIEGISSGETPYRAIRERAAGRWDLLRIFRRVVASGDYDLIVVPQVEATVLLWLACLLLRPRLVLYLHGNTDKEQSHWKAKVLFLLMRTVVINRLASVFGVSPTQLEAFRSRFLGACPHIWVPNPVRTFDRAADPRRRSSAVVTFVNVSRFSYQKGHDFLIEAFADLHEMRPNSRLVLVGYGELEAEVRAAIKARGLERAISIVSHLSNPQPVLAGGDVYISASRWEGWGLAICEALRFGLPVVATDCDFGPSDILTDERLGRLVAMGEKDRLVEAMVYYFDNIDEESRHAEFRKAYVDRFSLGRVVQVHAEALLSVAGGAGA
jgi:glycosyltransferase involved in cell wall biosynthesis